MVLLPLTQIVSPQLNHVSQQESTEVQEEAVLVHPVLGHFDVGTRVGVLSQVKKLGSGICSVVRVIPVWLLVISPLVVVEVFLSPGLVVTPLASLVLVDVPRTVLSHGLLNVLLNVVSLTSNGRAECLISFLDLLKHLVCMLPLRFSEIVGGQEIRVVLFGHLVVGKFHLLLRGAGLDLEDCVQVLLLLLEVEEDGPGLS